MVEDQILSEPMLSEPMSWREICTRYPNEWVVLVDVDWVGEEDDGDFRSARVAGHGKTRREPLVQARPLWSRYGEIAHFFTGRLQRSNPIFVGLE